MHEIDLAAVGLRTLNRRLHEIGADSNERAFRIRNPRGAHAIAAGLTQALEIVVEGHAGFYCAGMNQAADIVVNGHAGPGVAENMMSGSVRVKGNASQSAGASGHGGLLVIEGDAAARCGISMKGIDIVVGGSVGHMSAFMGQSGHLVVLGDAGHDLGDSIYEAVLFVQGKVESLGADCIEKPMRPEHLEVLARLLARAGMAAEPSRFRRYGSARRLYHFHVDHADKY
jgi:glutamate synthase domain-containing protein 3